MSKANFSTIIMVLFLLLNLTFSAQSQFKKQTNSTWVFMVGVLEWADKEEFASFDKRGRLDTKIYNYFKNTGIPENHIIYMKDKEATTEKVRKTFVDFLKKAPNDAQLFFYYCGHGYKNENEKVCFANYSGLDWTAEEIVKTVNINFAGKTAYFTADCCNSGGLAQEVQKYPSKNFAALNSVVPTDISTGNWTFSNALLYGLEGQNFMDTNNDRKVTLGELAAYIDIEMAIVEGQKSAFFIPKNMANWVISDNISPKKNKRIGEKVEVNYDGEDYLGFIVDADNNEYNVRFYSYLNNETDWVAANELKPFKCKKDFTIGASVMVYDNIEQGWFSAKVLRKFSCLHYIHYDGYDNEWDKWVSTDAIKKK